MENLTFFGKISPPIVAGEGGGGSPDLLICGVSETHHLIKLNKEQFRKGKELFFEELDIQVGGGKAKEG